MSMYIKYIQCFEQLGFAPIANNERCSSNVSRIAGQSAQNIPGKMLAADSARHEICTLTPICDDKNSVMLQNELL